MLDTFVSLPGAPGVFLAQFAFLHVLETHLEQLANFINIQRHFRTYCPSETSGDLQGTLGTSKDS